MPGPNNTGSPDPSASSSAVPSAVSSDPFRIELLVVLTELRVLLERDDNDFSWSSWEDRHDAVAEIDTVIGAVRSGRPVLASVLFAPTGPLQEVAASSGWAGEFLGLADRFEVAEALAPAEVSFACSLCGGAAGSVTIRKVPSGAEVERSSFTSRLTQGMGGASLNDLEAALAFDDAGALFGVDRELAPFYCPECSKTYCGDHWVQWDEFDPDDPSWHDCIRGRCPAGHERMLED